MKRKLAARTSSIVGASILRRVFDTVDRVESRISINAATLSLAFTKANIGGEKKPSADVDERRQFSFKSSPCRCALSIITMSPLLHVYSRLCSLKFLNLHRARLCSRTLINTRKKLKDAKRSRHDKTQDRDEMVLMLQADDGGAKTSLVRED